MNASPSSSPTSEWPALRIAQWVVLLSIAAASFAVDAAGYGGLSWALDGVLLVVYLVFRQVRARAAGAAGQSGPVLGPSNSAEGGGTGVGRVVAVTDATFEQAVLRGAGPVLVDFWAPWCGPCRRVAPVLEALAAEHPEILVAKLNTDENPATAARYAVTSIPTLNVYVRGEVVGTVIGAKRRSVLERELAAFLTASS